MSLVIIKDVFNDIILRSIFIKLVLVISIYGSLFLTFYMTFKTIDSRQYGSIDVMSFEFRQC